MSTSLLALTACGGGGAGGIFSSVLGSGSGGGGAIVTAASRLALGGAIVTGTVANAMVFQDIDGDGFTSGVDPYTFTDSNGNYNLEIFPGSGQIVVLDSYYVDSAGFPVTMNILEKLFIRRFIKKSC